MNSPRVSVLMSVHNGERWLGEAIDSILGQTFSDFEFIIIDDASKDGSKEIINGYDDARIVLVENRENLGLTASLNKGLGLCRGEYIARIDADDISMPERLKIQVDAMDGDPELGVLGSSYLIIDENEKELTKAHAPTGSDLINWVIILRNPFAHSSVMLRKSVLDDHSLFYDESYKASQDYDLWERMLSVTRGNNIDKPLIKFRVHDKSVSSTKKNTQIESGIRVAKHAIARLGMSPPDSAIIEKMVGDLQWGGESVEYSDGAITAAEEVFKIRDFYLSKISNSSSARKINYFASTQAYSALFYSPISFRWLKLLLVIILSAGWRFPLVFIHRGLSRLVFTTDSYGNLNIFSYLGGQGAGVLAVNAAGIATVMASHIFIARVLGIEDYGLYTFVISLTAMGILFSQFGIEHLLLKKAPIYFQSGEKDKLLGLILVGIFSILTTVTIASILATIWIYNAPELGPHTNIIVVMAILLVLFLSFLALFQHAFMGIKRFMLGKIMTETVRPVLIVAFIGAAIMAGVELGVAQVLAANILSITLLSIVSSVILWRAVGFSSSDKPYLKTRTVAEWLKSSSVMMMYYVPQVLIVQTDVLMMGYLLGTEHVGGYWAAAKIALVVSFPLYAVNTVASPILASRYSQGKDIRAIVKMGAIISFALCLVAAIFIAGFGDFFLGLFGDEFSSSYMPLLILVVGYVLISAAGPVDYALLMAGREKVNAKIMGITFLMNASLNMALIPEYGSIGAAIATVTALLIGRIAQYVAVRNYLTEKQCA